MDYLNRHSTIAESEKATNNAGEKVDQFDWMRQPVLFKEDIEVQGDVDVIGGVFKIDGVPIAGGGGYPDDIDCRSVDATVELLAPYLEATHIVTENLHLNKPLDQFICKGDFMVEGTGLTTAIADGRTLTITGGGGLGIGDGAGGIVMGTTCSGDVTIEGSGNFNITGGGEYQINGSSILPLTPTSISIPFATCEYNSPFGPDVVIPNIGITKVLPMSYFKSTPEFEYNAVDETVKYIGTSSCYAKIDFAVTAFMMSTAPYPSIKFDLNKKGTGSGITLSSSRVELIPGLRHNTFCITNMVTLDPLDEYSIQIDPMSGPGSYTVGGRTGQMGIIILQYV